VRTCYSVNAICALALLVLGCTSTQTTGSGGDGGGAAMGGLGGIPGAGGTGDHAGAGGDSGAGGTGNNGGDAGSSGSDGMGGAAGSAGAGGVGGVGGAGGVGGGGSLCPEGAIDVYGDGLNCRCDCAAACPEPGCGCSEALRFVNESDSMTIDCITPDVCLTRNTGGPLINVLLETYHDQYKSPLGTSWAPNTCAKAVDGDFVPFNEALDFLVVQKILRTPLCMFLQEAKLKYDVSFMVWERSNQGGAFEYVRAPYYADGCAHADAICGASCGCPEGFVADPETGLCRLMSVEPG